LWPTQIADALRGLIHEANLARDAHRDLINPETKAVLVQRFRDGVLVGLTDTTSHGDRPGERKARLLLEVLRDRPTDVLHFAEDRRVPPTSNQPNATYAQASCNRTSPAVSPARNAHKTATPSAATSPQPPNTATNPSTSSVTPSSASPGCHPTPSRPDPKTPHDHQPSGTSRPAITPCL
jgi:hypothetical protein